jgi:hypothetical protein
MYTPWARVGAEVPRVIAPTNPSAANVLESFSVLRFILQHKTAKSFARSDCSRAEHHSGFELTVATAGLSGQHPSLNARNFELSPSIPLEAERRVVLDGRLGRELPGGTGTKTVPVEPTQTAPVEPAQTAIRSKRPKQQETGSDNGLILHC